MSELLMQKLIFERKCNLRNAGSDKFDPWRKASCATFKCLWKNKIETSSNFLPYLPPVVERKENLVNIDLCVPFGVSRWVCSAHLHLLAPWATRVLSQWMLHWWQVSAPRLKLPLHPPINAEHEAGQTASTVSLRCDPTGNRTQPISLGGAC